MPSHWMITLTGPAAPDIPLEAPHAVVSRWLDDDHKAPVKPYSLTPPSGQGPHTQLGIRLLDDALAGRLATHAEVGAGVRLGRHHFTIAAPPALQDGQSWEDLSATPIRRAWEVDYLSPVTFRRRDRTSPWPAPDSVLTSLAARWLTLDPGTATTVDRETRRSLWVSDVEGRSDPFTLKDTVVSGFLGKMRYVCDGDDHEAQTVSSLFALARYAGIGSHTAFGFGSVAVTASRSLSRAHHSRELASSAPARDR